MSFSPAPRSCVIRFLLPELSCSCYSRCQLLLLIRSFARAAPAAAPYRLSTLPFGLKKPHRGRKPSEDSFKTRWEKKRSLQIHMDQSVYQISMVDHEETINELEVELPKTLDITYHRESGVPAGWTNGSPPEFLLPPDSPFFNAE